MSASVDGFQQAEAEAGAGAVLVQPMAIRTWLGSVAPEWQAEPPETETPFMSSAMTSASPSRLSNQMLVVLAARGTGRPSANAVDAGAGKLKDAGFEAVAHLGEAVDGAVVERVHGQLGGLGQADDAGDVLGAGALAALMAAADQ
jgi:hypothetical protein